MQLSDDLLSGVERKNDKFRSKGLNLTYEFKQWYSYSSKSYTEQVAGEKTIFVVKSKI